MQLDRDVQVCGINLFAFLNTPCFEILFLLLFSMLFIWSTFFSIDDPSLLLQEYKNRNLFELWSIYFWWMDGMFCVTPDVGISMYMWVYVISIMEV
jgi:hypothetical protein